jgi:hypothetical protein
VRLTTTDHDRDKAGLVYVYPVVSRRAGGVSVGINLNPNKACNWRCAYCQVEGLVRGAGPPIDLARLERELDGFLGEVLHGDFMESSVPEGARSLRDVALSGDGEPTSSPDLVGALDVVGRVLERHGLLGELPVVLITNGSLVHKREVREALVRLAELGGVAWYKLDSATLEGQARWNDAHAGVERARTNLIEAATACPTWVQTFVAAWDGEPPSDAERAAYLALLADVGAALAERGARLAGVLLYGLARTSHQPEAARITALPAEWLERFADEIRSLGLVVRVSP